MPPSNTQRVENNRVSDGQLVRINDSFAGIADNRIQSQTPALVAYGPFTVLTSRLGAVLIAVIRDRVFVRHKHIFLASMKAVAELNSFWQDQVVRDNTPSGLGQLRCLRTKLENLPPLCWKRRFLPFVFLETLRRVKFNYFCHNRPPLTLQPCEFPFQ